MSDNQEFAQLLDEFRRVGVDPDTFSAVIAVPPDDALRVLRDLPDGAGPSAFLHRLRQDREVRQPPDPVRAQPRDVDDVRRPA